MRGAHAGASEDGFDQDDAHGERIGETKVDRGGKALFCPFVARELRKEGYPAVLRTFLVKMIRRVRRTVGEGAVMSVGL